MQTLNLSHKSIPQLEDLSAGLRTSQIMHLVDDVTFVGAGPKLQAQSMFSLASLPHELALRRRILGARILGQFPDLRAVELAVEYKPADSSGLETLLVIEGSLANNLLYVKLDGDVHGKGVALHPEPVAVVLRRAHNLRTLHLRNVGLGHDKQLWFAMAKLKDMTTLFLEVVAFPPTVLLDWSPKIEHFTCERCPGADITSLVEMTSMFAESLTDLKLCVDPPRAESPAFYLPHLIRLQLYSDQPLDLLPLFKRSPLEVLTVRCSGGGFFTPRARIELVEGIRPHESTLKVFCYDEGLLDAMDTDELRTCFDYCGEVGIEYGCLPTSDDEDGTEGAEEEGDEE